VTRSGGPRGRGAYGQNFCGALHRQTGSKTRSHTFNSTQQPRYKSAHPLLNSSVLMNKQFLVSAIATLTLTAALSVTLASGQTAAAHQEATKPKMAEEVYKNIEVFKGVPADQLIPAMQFITSALGVECSYCHAEGAFEKDDKKPKQAARKMVRMMFAINQENFDGHREVTCYSCHRGSPHPVATPVIAEAGSPLASAAVEPVAPLSDLPGAEQILAKYVEAVGGASAVEKVSARVEKGSIEIGGRQFPVELFSKMPGKRVSIIHLPNGDSITALDGTTGWTSAPGRPTRDIPAPEVASARLEADLQLPVHFQQLFSEMKTGNPEKIGDHDVYVVSGGSAGEVAAKFYFDQHSGLLLRMLRYSDSPIGRNPTQVDYSDYRDQGHVKVPFQRTVSSPRSRYSIRIEQVQDNVPVDDKFFIRPAAMPPEKQPAH
jgi:photosynthetic reaction center cytochrome c subunit